MGDPKLTSEEHAAKFGHYCPQCGSDEIEGRDMDFDAGYIGQKMGCLVCEASWIDVYSLVGYDYLETA